MSSTRRMAFCRSPPMKIAIRTPQRGKLFYVHKDFVTKRSGIFQRLVCKAIFRKNLRESFHGASKNCAQLLLLGKGESSVLVGCRLQLQAARRWECLSGLP